MEKAFSSNKQLEKHRSNDNIGQISVGNKASFSIRSKGRLIGGHGEKLRSLKGDLHFYEIKSAAVFLGEW